MHACKFLCPWMWLFPAMSVWLWGFTPTELCKLFARLPFGPEKLALTWKIFFVSVSLRSEQFRQIVPKSLSRGNTSPRRSSRLWHVFVFCFPENNFLRNAGLSISLPHWRQVFSGTATRIKVLVGIFSSSIPLPNHWSISRGAKSILTVWQAALHAASWEVRAKMTSLDVIRCKGNKLSVRSLALRASRSLALRARTIALCAHSRATRSKARLVSKSKIFSEIAQWEWHY